MVAPPLSVREALRSPSAAMSFRRDLTPLNAFGVTFSTVSVLFVFSSDSLHNGFVHGGPVVMVWGWLVVSALSVVTAVCLAEMAACMPAAVGSLYFFTARLAPWRHKALATWVAAWANLVAALGTTSYYALVTTKTLGSAARLERISASSRPYDPYDTSYSLTLGQEFGIYCAVLLSWLALVSAPLSMTAGFITASSLWQIFGGGALFGSLLALAPRRQSAAFVLTGWTDVPGGPDTIRNVPYTVLLGLLFPITALTGYETVLYFVEELIVHRHRRRRWLDTRAAPSAAVRRLGSGTNDQPTSPAQKPTQSPAQVPVQVQAQHRLSALTPAPSCATALLAAAATSAGSGGGGGGSKQSASPPKDSAAAAGAQDATGTRLTTDDERRQQRQKRLRSSSWADVFRQQQQQRLLRQQQQGAAVGSAGGGRRALSVLPLSICGGLAASCSLALVFIVLLLIAMPSLSRAVDPRNETKGADPMSQVIYDILKATYGSGRGASGLISVLAVGTYSSGLVCAAGTSRKLWAMATDGFVPRWLSGVSTATRVPVHAAVAATAAAAAPGLLILAGDWAADACLSYILVAINASYLLPVVLRLLPSGAEGYDVITRRVGLEGGFTLGRASKPCFVISGLWLSACCLLALLPPAWPPTAYTANWAPVSSAAVALLVAASWGMPRWGARRWFRGLASVGGVSYW